MNVGKPFPSVVRGVALAFCLYLVPLIRAATLTVTSTADSGAGSLRDTIAGANPGDTIVFISSLSGQTIQLTSGELLVTKNLTIGSTLRVLLSASGGSRVLEISGANVTLSSLSLESGHLSGLGFPMNSGGGAFVNAGASLTAGNCIFSGNSAINGGGIYNLGTLTLNNCTLVSDSAPGNYGGGIFNSNGVMTLNGCTLSSDSAAHGAGICNSNGTVTLNNCTLALNNAINGFGAGIENDSSLTLNNCTLSANNALGGSGGGIYNSPSGAVLVMTNTIVAGNTGGSGADLSGSYTGVNNLVGSPPYLYPLGSYGGPTQTMPPGAGSPVIDAGTDLVTNFLATDQRGLARLEGAHVDIGAVEFAPNPVSTAVDSIPGSLRYAITYTSGGVITFASALSGQTIQLTNGELLISSNVTIDASALPGGIAINGGGKSRVFEISNGSVTLNFLTITNGNVANNNSGGGVLIDSSSLTLNNCTLSGNHAAAGLGGGLFNQGGLTLNNCTLSGNSAASSGGAIQNSGSLTLNNCTISGNSASGGPGGGINTGVTSFLTNTIVAGNTASGGVDVFGSYIGVANFIGGNPQLAPLGNYGGSTSTMPPMAGSPVIDAGADSVSAFLSTDQRGYPRLSGAHVDIGAVEAQVVAVASAPVLKGTFLTNGFQLNFTNTAADFTALTSTNIALSLSNWTVLGNAMEISSGQYQFTDTSATNGERFYQVVSP